MAAEKGIPHCQHVDIRATNKTASLVASMSIHIGINQVQMHHLVVMMVPSQGAISVISTRVNAGAATQAGLHVVMKIMMKTANNAAKAGSESLKLFPSTHCKFCTILCTVMNSRLK